MNKLNNIKKGLFALIMCLSFSLCGCGSGDRSEEKVDNSVITNEAATHSKSEETTDATSTEETTTETETSTTTEAATEAETTTPDEPPKEMSESTYEHNEYYDIVETSTFQDAIGYTVVIHKVLAKKDVSISGTLLAYSSDGNVIGKSSDDITLTEGKYNYFRYSFDGDISNADIKPSAKAKEDSFMTGERNAVEMVQYNRSGDDLFITFEQTADEAGSLGKFKLLFYKGDKIVDTVDGYLSIYVENLTGKGSTDVASIWVYNKDFDRIEYIYEP